MPKIMRNNVAYTGGGGGSSSLSELSDVSISSPTNNQVLAYNNSTNKWVNATPSGGGITSDVRDALLNCFAHVTWADAYGPEYYNALDAALNGKTVVGITATFDQSSASVSVITPLELLRPYLTVTLDYDDTSSFEVNNYTLSGTLTVGTSTITVTYNGYTTTFTVNVSATEVDPVFGTLFHYIDFRYADSSSNFVDAFDASKYATIGSGCTYTEGTGVQGFVSSTAYITLPAFSDMQVNDAFVLEFGEITWSAGSNHGRLLMYSGDSGLIYRSGSYWNYYGGSGWGNNISASQNYFSNAKLGVKVIASNQLEIYKDGVLLGTETNSAISYLINGNALTIGSPSAQGYGTALLKSLKIYRATS